MSAYDPKRTSRCARTGRLLADGSSAGRETGIELTKIYAETPDEYLDEVPP